MSKYDDDTSAAGGAGITWSSGSPKSMQQIFAPYVQCMLSISNGSIDLSQYSDSNQTGVFDNISVIAPRIESGSMPAGAEYQKQWAADNGKALFLQWQAAGYPQQ